MKWAKNLILKINKLRPEKCRQMFNSAQKLSTETFAQFVHHLSVSLNYYLKSREIGGSFEKLCNLLICDKLKDVLGEFLGNGYMYQKGGNQKTSQV